jgi:hypothetical protein
MHLVVPTVFEIWVMNADGTHKRQVTKLESASFAPFFTPTASGLFSAQTTSTLKRRTADASRISTSRS